MSRLIFLWSVVVGLFLAAASLRASTPASPPAIAGAASVLTSFWEDATQREVFVVAGRDLLGPEGASPWAELPDGTRLIPAPRDFIPNWQVHTGQKSAPAVTSAARMNVWRATPVYWEIHLRDIPFVPDGAPASAPPLRVHLVIHAHPDRAHLEFRAESAMGAPNPLALGWTIHPSAPAPRIQPLNTREALAWPGSAALLAPLGGDFASGAAFTARAPAAAAWFVLRPAKTDTVFEEL
ncbi:MAG: hypothetical protein MUE42_14625, partial [Opitutaceae bacterium]|nr:hypothetical protein [Opitutaceae bacterium]